MLKVSQGSRSVRLGVLSQCLPMQKLVTFFAAFIATSIVASEVGSWRHVMRRAARRLIFRELHWAVLGIGVARTRVLKMGVASGRFAGAEVVLAIIVGEESSQR